jgi:hypothetical protein
MKSVLYTPTIPPSWACLSPRHSPSALTGGAHRADTEREMAHSTPQGRQDLASETTATNGDLDSGGSTDDAADFGATTVG